MARGRHRSSALHKVLIPAGLGTLALACAGGAWLLGDGDDAIALRALVAVAAATTVACAVLLRRWDLAAGRQVARERAAKAGLAWQIEERQAELEEAQEQVTALEEKIQGKRLDLGRLRSEHADLLRRYATAESERAKALEGRRQLALEAAQPAKALPAQATDHRTAGGAPTPLTYRQAHEALAALTRSAARQREAREAREEAGEAGEAAEAPESRDAHQAPAAVAPPPPRSGSGFDFFGTGAPHGRRDAPRPEQAGQTGQAGEGSRETSGRGRSGR
ncbi:hypothetical protein [Streptomyces sp. MP131-18]|uniref:hypothetical protein n=1 Tax=Streptomyces sp. MP131-18 TaxID=1857892 RepID=UPI0009C438B9|nr:hypothetical protein [Streptomyces sp. MP131-18]ONK12341.1 hypothetical protein STBA_30830 [Streptomyces sp. MP131-18]